MSEDDHAGGVARLTERLREAEEKIRRLELSIAADAAERKKGEEALRKSERELREAQRLGGLGSWDWDAGTDTITWSPEYRRLVGYDPVCPPPKYEEHLRRYTPESAARLDAAVKRNMTTGEPYEIDLELAGSDAPCRWITARSETVRAADGRITGLRGTAQDITGRKQAEADVARYQAELERRVTLRTAELEAANRELEAFAYSVSHDLRAPVRHVSAFMAMLHERIADSVDDQSAHYLQVIEAAAKSMGAMIDDLLAFSRMGRAELARRSVDVDHLVHAVVDELAPEAAGRAIEWVIGSLPVVDGDPAMLRLVFTNLLANALKFTRAREHARVEVGCTDAPGPELVVFVRDNGVGFDMTYLHKLFRVFQRLHRVEEFEGTGIGLASVRRIIERHGGRVWAEGALGAGATFYVALPRGAAAR